jgi:N-acetylmuramic acid 6-phosphate etherase
MKSRGELKTEQQNLQSSKIDSMSINDILKTINREDQNIAIAVQTTIRDIEKTVELTVNSIRKGGRVFYVGAGTSGRLGVLDASEIPPTYSVPKGLFIGVIAGGENALRNSIEGAEDRPNEAIIDLAQYELNENDTLVGISCSGAASYVVSALEHAKASGAKTVYLVTNPNPYKITEVDVIINAVTGPEVVTGSTRMKAGTATKLILNMISTTTMIKLGKVYGNLMVDLMAVNDKLVDRGTRIIEQLTDLDYDDAQLKLFEAEKSVKTAIVMGKFNCTLNEAREKLENASGFLRNLID